MFSPNSRYLTNFQGDRWIWQFEGGNGLQIAFGNRQKDRDIRWLGSKTIIFIRMLLSSLVQYGMFRHFLTSFLSFFNFNNLFLQSLMNIFAIIIIIAGHFGRKKVKKIALFFFKMQLCNRKIFREHHGCTLYAISNLFLFFVFVNRFY